MKAKVILKKVFLVMVPTALFFLLDVACMGFAVFIAVQLVMNLVSGSGDVSTAEILASIAATTLSFAIALTGLATFLVSYVKGFKKSSIEKTKRTTAFIKEFNDTILDDLNMVERILNSTLKKIGWDKSFKPVLSDQKELFDEFNKYMEDKSIVYKQYLYYYCASIFYLEKDELNSEMKQFCKDVAAYEISDAKKYVKSIGAIQLLYVFKRKRVAILNYFENLGICYINELVDRKLVDEQLKDMLETIIPKFYYEIYRLEKTKSYPYLNKMLDIMQSK